MVKRVLRDDSAHDLIKNAHCLRSRINVVSKDEKLLPATVSPLQVNKYI